MKHLHSLCLNAPLAGVFAVGLGLPASALVADDPEGPLSSLVAVVVNTPNPAADLGSVMRDLVQDYVEGTLPAGVDFPLSNVLRDDIASIRGTGRQVVTSWLDPLSDATGAFDPRFGANCDYTAWFGDGWDADWSGEVVGRAPQFSGSGSGGWLWVNHEYVSGGQPGLTNAPSGQQLTYAKFLAKNGVLTNDVTSDTWSQEDVDTYIDAVKRTLGGSWFRVERAANGRWAVEPSSESRRYDSTSDTLVRILGQALYPFTPTLAGGDAGLDHEDDGHDLPQGVVSGIMGDCSGGQTPWGTILTAEENVQTYYGDLESTWTSQQRFVPGNGFDPGSVICPTVGPSRSAEYGRVGTIQGRHNRDLYGYLVEIDPTVSRDHYYTSIVEQDGDGLGHRKIGGMGRARWENAAFAIGSDWRLVSGQKVVIYGGDDRRSGRIWKWISAGSYVDGMTRAEVRALLDEGSLYVAHFAGLDNSTGQTMLSTGLPPTEAQPGIGQWLHVSVDSTDVPPNAAALGKGGITIGEALRDVDYNGIGGFPTDDHVRIALFTVANKLGVMELNRPEDIEWNPLDPSGTPRLYVAFTNHTARVALDQDGVLFDPADHASLSPQRQDAVGSIMSLQEAEPSNPASSGSFTFWTVWSGSSAAGPFDAADPDNIAIDAEGGVWFGTDGNVGTNGTADAIYYLDLDASHAAGEPGVVNEGFGRAFRIAATPADAEATGPAFTSDMKTLFFNVQHPGEDFENFPTNWPN